MGRSQNEEMDFQRNIYRRDRLAGAGGAAWAGAHDDFGCSNATLKGEYAFGVTAYTPPVSQMVRQWLSPGIKFFDGKGNLTQRDYIGDTLRTIALSHPKARKGHLHGQFRLHWQHGDQLERACPAGSPDN